MNFAGQHLRIISYALLGYTFWVVCDTCLKVLAATPMPKYEILLFLNLGSVSTVTLISLLRGRKKFLRSRKPSLCLVLGLLQLANMMVFLVALKRLSLATNYVIIFTGPMMIAILAALFLRERIGWAKILMIVVGFGGVIVALDPSRVLAGQGDWIGYGASFAAIIFYTVYMLLLRSYGDAENAEATVLYPRLLNGAFCLLAVFYWGYKDVAFENLALVLFGGVCAAIGWLFVAVASQQAPASIIAPYRYSQIITGAIAGYLIWHDKPTVHLVIGAIIIILSGLYIAQHTHRGAETLEKTEYE